MTIDDIPLWFIVLVIGVLAGMYRILTTDRD